jgi:hypothetical protein
MDPCEDFGLAANETKHRLNEELSDICHEVMRSETTTTTEAVPVTTVDAVCLQEGDDAHSCLAELLDLFNHLTASQMKKNEVVDQICRYMPAHATKLLLIPDVMFLF